MTDAVAKLPATTGRKSVLIDMATRYGMEPAAFEQTLRATVLPEQCTKEQFAAFLLVAKEYDLNPITKEIFAFPTQGGGIQPIVGVDGWMAVVNNQPQFDGMEFEDHLDGKKLTAITCRIFRKDRSHPTNITEYMSECVRSTSTWKQWPARMLRHKAAIQCARYAFGLSGIQEPDEYERSDEAVNITPVMSPPDPPGETKTESAGPPAGEEVEESAEMLPDVDAEPERIAVSNAPQPALPPLSATTIEEGEWNDSEALDVRDPEAYLAELEELASTADDPDVFAGIRDSFEERRSLLFPPDAEKGDAIIAKNEKRFE